MTTRSNVMYWISWKASVAKFFGGCGAFLLSSFLSLRSFELKLATELL